MGQVISDVNSCFISPEQLPDGGYGLVQLFFLFSVYGYVLFWAAEEIAEGSELLLLLPKARTASASAMPVSRPPRPATHVAGSVATTDSGCGRQRGASRSGVPHLAHH